MLQIIEDTIKKIIDSSIETLELYSISLVIPISVSIMFILINLTVGINTEIGVLNEIKQIWTLYYYDGHLLDVIAYRWHLSIIGILNIISFVNKY